MNDSARSWLFLVLLGMLCMSCSANKVSQQPVARQSEPQPQQFIIAESAYILDQSPYEPDKVYVQWVAVIRNPNAEFFGVFPAISITARDAQGNVLGTEDQVLHQLPPGKTIAFGGQITASARPEKIEISPTKVEWHRTKTTPADYPPFETQKVTLKSNGQLGFTITGEIMNPYKKNVEQLAVTALFRDETGRLTGGWQTFVESVPANGTRPFQINALTAPQNVAKVEVLASTWLPTNWNELATAK